MKETVIVHLTLSKTITIDVDSSHRSLEEAVMDQVYLPQEAGYLFKICLEEKQLPTLDKVEDLSNWRVENFKVNEI